MNLPFGEDFAEGRFVPKGVDRARFTIEKNEGQPPSGPKSLLRVIEWAHAA
ncbi:hypothetical protein [Sphingomonas oryzagri]|uniref:Uncharacterized protein n=1 Tax=Sphingomonas oryzagri TaxID=3042314 RepID=A0ABT6N1S3_9SPHN|nr:hypothetical protein [Sphingomonas oryzagri]MDH7639235.1 hypothetical protein [Sphingomonas oryzagri]